MYYPLYQGRFFLNGKDGVDFIKRRASLLAKQHGDPRGLKTTDEQNATAGLFGFQNFRDAQNNLTDGEQSPGEGKHPLSAAIEALREMPASRIGQDHVGYASQVLHKQSHRPHDEYHWGVPIDPKKLRADAHAMTIVKAVPFEIPWDRVYPEPSNHPSAPVPEEMPDTITALAALDANIQRLRIPRPWRVLDYHGVTTNPQYYLDRIDVGIRRDSFQRGEDWWTEGELLSAGKTVSAVLEQAGVSVRDLLVVEQTILSAVDQLGNLGMELSGTAVPVSVGLTEFQEAGILFHELSTAVVGVYRSTDRAAVPVLEAIRYLAWCFHLFPNDPDLLGPAHAIQIASEAQSYVQFVCHVAAGRRSAVDDDRWDESTVLWAPNAVTLDGAPEGHREQPNVHQEEVR